MTSFSPRPDTVNHTELTLYFISPFRYYLDHQSNPSPVMGDSILYQLHSARLDSTVKHPTMYEEVFTSEHKMVRIYKVKDVSEESREYCETHRNLDGSGNYPPALKEILDSMQAFDQKARPSDGDGTGQRRKKGRGVHAVTTVVPPKTGSARGGAAQATQATHAEATADTATRPGTAAPASTDAYDEAMDEFE
jgi:hypothetical protein